MANEPKRHHIGGQAAPGPEVDAGLKRLRWRLAGPLTVVSGLLALPMAWWALLGVFLIVPPLLWLAGVALLVGYGRTWAGARLGDGFWVASVIYNLAGACGWVWMMLVGMGDGDAGLWMALAAAMVLWCGLAAWLSLAIHRQPGLVAGPAPKPPAFKAPPPLLKAEPVAAAYFSQPCPREGAGVTSGRRSGSLGRDFVRRRSSRSSDKGPPPMTNRAVAIRK